MARGRISVRVDRKLLQELEQRAAFLGKRQSDVVREALEQHLVNRVGRETCYDLARRAGLVGAVKNAPADLSASRAHFDGFGRP